MPQQQSPFLEGKYGWNYGEDGWNAGMDENLLKFSFMFDRNVDGVVGSLPAAVNGQSYFLTTDNRLYFAVGTIWYSSPTPKWFEFKIKSSGDVYQFNGTSAVQIDSPASLDTRLDAVELTLPTLGSAAFEDVEFFATQAELDIVEGQAQAYTDTLRQDLANATDPAKGAALVGYKNRTISDKLDERSSVLDFGATGDGVTDDTPAFITASGEIAQVDIPSGEYYLSVDVTGNFNIKTGVTFTGPGIAFVRARGFWTTQPSGADIHRFSDRVFIAEAAEKSLGVQNAGNEGTWLVTEMGAGYLEREPHLLVVSNVGEYGAVFATRTSDKVQLGSYGDSSIGVTGVVQNDSLNPSQIGWASYFEANRISNLTTFGTEFAVKNRGNNTAATPYNYFGGAIGAWFAGGGDDVYNGAPTNPSDTAVLIGKNSASWNRGIVFGAEGITGTDGVTGTGTAINFAKGHAMVWSFNDGGVVRDGAVIASQVNSSNSGQRIVFRNGGLHFSAFDSNGGEVNTFIFGAPTVPAGQQLNGLYFGAIQQGGGYTNIAATGPDANINIRLTPKGSGVLQLGYLSQTASVPANFVASDRLQIRLLDGSIFYVAGRLNSPW